MRRTLVVLPLIAVCALGPAAGTPSADQAGQSYNPKIFPASNEGLKTMARVALPKGQGLKIDLFAAEPMLANPVAFCIDERGRFYVCETFRLHDGVTDNRNHRYWINDDIAARTVEERVAMYRKHLGKQFDSYAVHHDRVRLIEDTDGDGKADRATVFADGFKNHADGIGSGVLARGGDVWFTCIPDLWLLQDTKGAGQADVKKSLSYGYGVHVSFLGHDMHGLKLGPDGRLYFSIGDRGLHVVAGGKTLDCPDTGAVLRCNPDGSELELFATGLRNPQELTFDEFGNLFTGDNNADSGDKARWVHVVEGGDSGWRIGYQYVNGPLDKAGPWNSEKLWHLRHEGQATYILPPLDHITSGPSGLTYHPGVSQLPERYKNHFFLCDFRGGSGNSGVHAFTVRPKGATFEITRREQFAWSVLVTDCDFGPDGAFYLSDWVDGWGKTGKGRIYKITDPQRAKDPAVAEVGKLLADGMSGRTAEEQARLLGHADQRVRQEAQFALAESPEGKKTFVEVASKKDQRLARLHALWGLGQIARREKRPADEALPLLGDADAEVRVQAVKVLGDGKPTGEVEKLLPLFKDAEPRVRFEAAMAVGKAGQKQSAAAVVEMLRDNADKDAYLRHAGVMALAWLGDRAALGEAAKDKSVAVRRAALLAMRRLEAPEVAGFLSDSDASLVLEAARAVYDVPIKPALEKLAALWPRTGMAEPLAHRVMAANFDLGNAENARALAALAGRKDVTERLRVEAVQMLGQWAKPPVLDHVVGLWRPLPARPEADAATAVRLGLGNILSGSDKVRAEAVKVAAKLGIKDVGPALLTLVTDTKQPAAVRVETLLALETLKDARLSKATEAALLDDDPQVRAAGRRVFARQDPKRAVPLLSVALLRGQTVERQEAFAALGEMKQPEVDALLVRWLDRLLKGEVPAEVRLDLLEAAARKTAKDVKGRLTQYETARPKGDHLAGYRESMVGGSAEAGRGLFIHKTEISCLRCHKINGEGGDVGPDLTGIGAKQTREYLLEALVAPDKQIAKGYETVILALADGRQETGILKSEDARAVQLMTAEGRLVTVPKEQIEGRTRGPSAMPDDVVRLLSRRELRDLVEYLATLK